MDEIIFNDITENDSVKMETLENESDKMDTLENESDKMDISENVVSENSVDYTELLKEIIENERDIITAIERKSNVVVPVDNDIKYGNNNENVLLETVSSNSIMNTPIRDYTISESITLGIFIILLIGGFTIMIRKAVGQWK